MRLRHYILLLFILPFLAYFSSFWNQFVWDDEQFIYSNQYVHEFNVRKIFTESTTSGSGIGSDYYRPLTTLSFAIDTAVWDLKPFPFHLSNTLLHIASGIFIFILFLKLGIPKKSAFWIALLFQLHPLQTEAVSYINSRGDSLYTFFGMLSALSFVALLKKETYHMALYNLKFIFAKNIFVVTTILFYVFTILSKEIGIAILGINGLIFLYWYFTKSKGTIVLFLSKNKAATVALFSTIVVAVLYIILRATVLNFSNTFNLYTDGSLYSQNLLVRLLTFSKVVWIYFGLLLFPYHLHMERVTDIVSSPFSIWPLLTIALFCILLWISCLEFKKNHTVNIAFGTAWFFGMLIPVSGIIPINGILYEHWLYLPIVGFLCAVYGLYNFFDITSVKKILSRHIQIFLSAVVVLYIVLITRQNYFWSTPVRLYEYLLQYTESGRIYNNLGMAYGNEKNYPKAIEMYKKGIAFNDEYPQMYHNLANSYRDTGETKLAIENYQKALALEPKFYISYTPLINLLLQEKRYDETESLIAEIRNQWPTDSDSYFFEIVYLIELEKFTEAEKVLTELQQKFPTAQNQIIYARQLLQTQTAEKNTSK